MLISNFLSFVILNVMISTLPYSLLMRPCDTSRVLGHVLHCQVSDVSDFATQAIILYSIE